MRARTNRGVIPAFADHGHLLATSGSILSRRCCTSKYLGSSVHTTRSRRNVSLVTLAQESALLRSFDAAARSFPFLQSLFLFSLSPSPSFSSSFSLSPSRSLSRFSPRCRCLAARPSMQRRHTLPLSFTAFLVAAHAYQVESLR